MAKKRPISASTRELRAALAPKDPTRSVNPITGVVTKHLPPIQIYGVRGADAGGENPGTLGSPTGRK